MTSKQYVEEYCRLNKLNDGVKGILLILSEQIEEEILKNIFKKDV